MEAAMEAVMRACIPSCSLIMSAWRSQALRCTSMSRSVVLRDLRRFWSSSSSPCCCLRWSLGCQSNLSAPSPLP